jgi:hypothetical protein
VEEAGLFWYMKPHISAVEFIMVVNFTLTNNELKEMRWEVTMLYFCIQKLSIKSEENTYLIK